MNKNIEHKLHRELNAVKSFLESARDLIGDDDQLLTDMLEGETNLIEILQKSADQIDEEEILIDGIKTRIQSLQERKHLCEARISRIRTLIEQAILIAGDERSYKLPNMTLSLKSAPQQIIIKDETVIPSKFWIAQKPPAPKLDKKAIKTAIDEGENVTGCELDNGGYSLQIRRK